MRRMREEERTRGEEGERKTERRVNSARGNLVKRRERDEARHGEAARGEAAARGERKREGSANGRRATAIWQRLLWLSLRSVGKRGATRRDVAWRTKLSRAAAPPTRRLRPVCAYRKRGRAPRTECQPEDRLSRKIGKAPRIRISDGCTSDERNSHYRYYVVPERVRAIPRDEFVSDCSVRIVRASRDSRQGQ